MERLAPSSALLALFVLASLATSAVAAKDRADEDLLYRGIRATAGYSTQNLAADERQTTLFFVVPVRDGLEAELVFVARRDVARSGEANRTVWTSSETCLPLRNTLVWLTTLVAPRIEIAGISPSEYEPAGRRSLRMTADGVPTIVWGRGTQPDYTQATGVEIQSNGGLIADFGRSADRNLAECWADAPPESGT